MERTSAGISAGLPRDRLDAIALQVRRERGVAVGSLGLGKLTRSAQAELLSALGRLGLEHTGKAIRVPLREQVRAVVARAGELGTGEAALAQEVKGARSAAELRLVVHGLIAEGVLARLVDEDGPRLALHGAHLLTNAELDQLAALAQRLAALAKATKPVQKAPRLTLPHSLLDAPLATLRGLAKAASDATPVHGALRAAFLVAPTATGLIRVPDVIRALEQLHPRAALLAALSALARQGVLELRPEASITRIGEDDRARCTVALDGTPLSYARIKARPNGAQA